MSWFSQIFSPTATNGYESDGTVMRPPSKSSAEEDVVKRWIALTLFAVWSMAAAAWSQCNNPTSPGVVICTPTNGATVVYAPEISIRSTPAQGATISAFRLYDNNVDVVDGSPGQSGEDIYDFGIFDGFHHFVVNAWDSEGHLYQASTSVFITGLGYGPCSIPKSPGINFCIPPSGAVVPVNAPADVSATGTSAIKIGRAHV